VHWTDARVADTRDPVKPTTSAKSSRIRHLRANDLTGSLQRRG
jgi:hypothetical protein